MEIQASQTGRKVGGKYLSFALSDERYAVDILKVQEIIGIPGITKVPKSPDYLRGILNLRGTIIPIVDLRLKFGMEEREYDDKTCVIVISATLNEKRVAVGIVVDTVLDVMNFKDEDLQPSPQYGVSVDTSFISGMTKANSNVVILVDIEEVLEGCEAAITYALVR